MSQWNETKLVSPGNGVSEFQAAFNAGLAQSNQAAREAKHGSFVIVPEGFKVEDVSAIAGHRETPIADHEPKLATLASFCDYFNTFKTGASRIFANPTTRAFVGVIDYSAPGVADYCDHQANYTIELSADYKKWQLSNGKRMQQEEFALFVEEMAPQFVKPDAATMRELATELQVHNEVVFQSGIRMQDGQVRFQYVENINGKAGKAGDIDIPPMFEISVPIFYGGKSETLSAWFRYRLMGSKLTLWYELYRADEVVAAAFDAAVADTAKTTDTKVWLGSL